MKSSQLFWGFFFIAFGALYLVGRYTSFIIDWYAIWELWPVIIILAGLAIILKGTFFKPVVSVLMGILMAFLAFGFFNDMFDVFDGRNFNEREYETRHYREVTENNYTVDYDSNIEHVNLKVQAGAGRFNIEKTTDNLVRGYSRSNIGNYNFTNTQKDSVTWIDISLDDFDDNIFGNTLRNQFKISLNENPTYNITAEIGAAKTYFNLIPFKINNLVLKTGASETKIKIGDKSEMVYVNVEIGAAAMKLYIPKSSGCKINGDMVLMKKELDGFEKHGSDYYTTRNYETAANKIIMEIQGGVSSFEVKRY